MEEQFYTILTSIGKAKIANSNVLGSKLNLTKFIVGDSSGSYYNPTEEQTELKNKVWEGSINSINIDKNNPNWIVIETVIPSDIGGFTIREAGILDNENNLIAVAKYPETYKPLLKNGSSKDIILRVILEISNASNVTLKVDPSVTIATKQDVLNLEKDFDKRIKNCNSINSFYDNSGTEKKYYISNSGSDCNDGSEEKPFKTLNKAFEVMPTITTGRFTIILLSDIKQNTLYVYNKICGSDINIYSKEGNTYTIEGTSKNEDVSFNFYGVNNVIFNKVNFNQVSLVASNVNYFSIDTCKIDTLNLCSIALYKGTNLYMCSSTINSRDYSALYLSSMANVIMRDCKLNGGLEGIQSYYSTCLYSDCEITGKSCNISVGLGGYVKDEAKNK